MQPVPKQPNGSRAKPAAGKRALAVVVATLYALPAYAEPGGSSAHIPFLFAVVGLMALAAGAIPIVFRKQLQLPGPAWVPYAAGIVIAIVVAFFVGPMVIIFGSIVITGRTM